MKTPWKLPKQRWQKQKESNHAKQNQNYVAGMLGLEGDNAYEIKRMCKDDLIKDMFHGEVDNMLDEYYLG